MKNSPKIVIAGCGGVSGAWLENVEPLDLNLVGLVDLNLENAKTQQEKFRLNDAFVSDDLKEAVNKTGADIVFDCTIPEAHEAVALTALEAGCHVLSEKPLAASMEAARRIQAKAEEKNLIHAVSQNRRYGDNIQKVKSLIASEEIGKVTTLNCDFFLGAHFGGFREKMQHVLLLDMAIHSFDQARYLSSANPLSVYCHEWNPEGAWNAHGSAAVAIFEMSNGIIFTYRGSWVAEGLDTNWNADWRIIGTKGTLAWDGANGIKGETVVETSGFKSTCRAVELSGTSVPDAALTERGRIIKEFLACIETGDKPRTHSGDNINSLAMVFAAIESAKTGQKVNIHV